MKKLVVKLDLHDGKAKQKAMRAVSSLSGIDSISVDMKEKKLTVTGDVDPVHVVNKLRKSWHTDIVLVGPAKEPEKKKEEKPKKDDEKKKDQEKLEELVKAYHAHNLYKDYYGQRAEENPNVCVIS